MEIKYFYFEHTDPKTRKMTAVEIWHNGEMRRITETRATLLLTALEVAKLEYRKRLEEILGNYYHSTPCQKSTTQLPAHRQRSTT